MISAQEIRQLRQDTGLSVIQFAQLFAVAPSTVSHWETDRSSPSLIIQFSMIELRGRIQGIVKMSDATTDAIKKTLLGLILGGGLVAFMTWLYTRKEDLNGKK